VKIAAVSGTQTTVSSQLSGPAGVAVDGAGNVFIADPGNQRVVEVSPGGVQTVVPATGLTQPQSVAVDGSGDLFISDYANNAVVEITSGGVQTTVNATSLSQPQGVVVDGAGNVFIADSGNHQVVEIDTVGQIELPVTGLVTPSALAVDAAGDVFVTDSANGNIVELPADGSSQITGRSPQITVAAGLSGPEGVALDAAGDVFIADTNNSRVLEVELSQQPSLTFAATSVGSTSSDSPQSITVQNIGNQTLAAVAPGLAVTGPNFVQIPGSGTPADCTSSFGMLPGASCNLSLSFTPQSAGPLTSTAVFTDNALNTSPSATQTIALAGTGNALIAVPNVVGLTQAAATSAITSAGLVAGTPTTASSTTVPMGDVISESPVAGTAVNSGSAVALVISTGVSVPNVVGLTQTAATSAIASAGLVAGTPTTASSTTVPIGDVISESPTAGTAVNGGSTVALVISTGVSVPDVVGSMQSAAMTAITGAGLVVGTVTPQASTTVASGNVISESPTAGTSVNSGSSVNLVVSSGPPQVAVPNVVGNTQAAATTAITGAGLVVGTVMTASSTTVPSGSVISETPAAGTSVNGGTSVNLIVSSGPVLYLLTTAANPVGGGVVSPASGNQTANSVAALTATPSAGYVFANWSGPVASPNSASTTVTMSAPETVTANFVSAVTVVPSSINFGTVYQGSVKTADVTVTNAGASAITISGPLFAILQGGNSNEFVTLNLCPKSLAAGKSCTMTVTFTAGPYYTPQTAMLKVTDNAAGSPQSVMLSATVIDPVAKFSATSLSFGTVETNSGTATKSVTLTNSGGTALAMPTFSITGADPADFSQTDTCSAPLAPKATCSISLTFKPTVKGPRAATLVTTDNAQNSPQTISLSGSGN
jgi:beta-lactam-binding protein with PASTA domain/sugar lactone lactonase YvrE